MINVGRVRNVISRQYDIKSVTEVLEVRVWK